MQRITTSNAADRSPTWSPNGNQLAFVSNRGGSFSLYIYDFADNEVTLLAQNASDPSWSPTGTQIAYVSGGDLFVVSVASGTINQVTTFGTVQSGAWSPNGTQLVFSAGGDLWITAVFEGTPNQITSGTEVDIDPAWWR
ncbi:MAG: hypothetical protein GYB68_02025 [Chloroflexi bacterium]|nr:hypothetical protein [Chloroflexota bacterium]